MNRERLLMTGNGDPFEYYPRLARLRAYIKANLSQPISLADAARVAALEKKYFSRYFKACVGRNFSDWLLEQQIGHAVELLRDRDCSISSLAFRTGCHDLRTFERRFKRVTGVTPRELRSRIRKTAHAKDHDNCRKTGDDCPQPGEASV
jgi:AraC-like DNA-binding protein